MEGTRNEKAAIIVTAYIIGFITAYIAFGVVQLEDSVDFAQISSQNMASVITATHATQDPLAFIAIDKDGLVLIKGGKKTLISATVPVDVHHFLPDGQNVAISDYALSTDKANVYFCEVPSIESESCRPYIYSITDDIVYPITVHGERVAFEKDGQTVQWSKDNQLLIE